MGISANFRYFLISLSQVVDIVTDQLYSAGLCDTVVPKIIKNKKEKLLFLWGFWLSKLNL